MKKILKTSIVLLSSLFALPVAFQSQATVYAEGEVTSTPTAEDLAKVEAAKDYLNLNVDLNTIVSNIYLPNKSLYNAAVTWASSNANVISKDGKVTRPAAGQQPIEVTLTATITVSSATATKEFKCRVLPSTPYTPAVTENFEENFNTYKTGLDISNYFNWDLSSGDEIAKIAETVKNNNTVGGDKVLDFQPLPTLYKDTIYRTTINVPQNSEMVFETYLMASGSLSGFRIEFARNSSVGISLGVQDSKFVLQETVDKNTITKEIGDCLDGVWYKVRVEMDMSQKLFHVYLHDYVQNEVTKLSVEAGQGFAPNTPTSFNYLRLKVLKGKNDLDSHVYLSNMILDKKEVLSDNTLGTNPNRAKGIGTIENYTESFLLVQNEALEIPEFVIHNRFKPDEILIKNTDYTIQETYGANGNVDVTKVGDYEKIYTISLIDTQETLVLRQVFHVDGLNDAADLDTFRIAPVVDDLNVNYVDKKVTISANIDRKNSTVYYVATDPDKPALSAQEVKNAAEGNDSSITIKGKQVLTSASFEIEVLGLDSNKEYNFYVVTENEKGVLSEVYKKEDVSVSVYNIESCDDFFFMCTDPDVQTTNFRLMKDLDFENYYWAASEITRPEYKGTFDGQGHTIRNLEIHAPYKKASLFYEFAGTFKNLTMIDCLLSGAESVGFIGGYAFLGATVSNVSMINCEVNYNTDGSSGDGYYGLVFGRCDKTGGGSVTIDRVNIENGIVNGPKYVGAMVGNLKGVSLTISNTYCQATVTNDNAASGLVSRTRSDSGTMLTVKDTYADITIPFAKKEVAVISGHLENKVVLENVLGKLTVQSMTQPTYYNNLTGRYGTTASCEFKNVYFFDPDVSALEEDSAVTPVSASRSVGTVITKEPENTQKWWETNTCFKNFDTNKNWRYDENKMRPVLRDSVIENLEFTAAEINQYIDAIGNKITSESIYYINKAKELYEYCKESERSQVHLDVLEKAEKDYEAYIAALNSALDSLDDVYQSVTGGIEWGYQPKEAQ